ncbi:hypothetical protein T03_11403 [Trichinella britovi]|uniref:Uncharacterized protein n=1 Tax=Trichinella britovi TaxID=45882 RepID=A0A0V1CH94_TRIBR|nr:hypothetical protein T03_11403 [Trichinella britovi]
MSNIILHYLRLEREIIVVMYLKNVNGRIDFNNLPTTYDSPLFSRGGKMRDDAVIIFTKKDPQKPCVLRLLVQLGYTFSSSNQVARVVWWEGWN